MLFLSFQTVKETTVFLDTSESKEFIFVYGRKKPHKC